MPEESLGARASLRDIHVFVISDDSESRELLRTVLEYAGALVSVAMSERAALAGLEALRPDVLLADVGERDADPVALLTRVRALPDCAEIPSIVVTADGVPGHRARMLASGFQEHLSRPVDTWELCQLVQQLAARRR